MQIIKNLHDVKEKIRAQWNKLTDDDINESKGNVDDLQGRLKKAYGYDEKQARREFDDFTASNGLEFEDDNQLLDVNDPTVSPAAPIMPRDGKVFQ
jgi:uncharacterized protein YjbJ (UPF0337 family)